jgi:hypothetical protein
MPHNTANRRSDTLPRIYGNQEGLENLFELPANTAQQLEWIMLGRTHVERARLGGAGGIRLMRAGKKVAAPFGLKQPEKIFTSRRFRI